MTIPQLKNAKQKPRTYYARHMFPGVAEYSNERIQIDNNTMKKMCRSMVECPVYVYHKDVDIENIHNADGFVSDNFINPYDGWMWSKFMVISDAGHDAVAKGWAVSNAYKPIAPFGPAGTQHNVDYDRKILNAEFTHLAIVPNPRYEEAKIFTPEEYKDYNAALKTEAELINSKNINKGKPAMFFFKKTPIDADKVTDADHVEMDDGTIVTVAEMKNALEADAKAKEKETADAAAKEKAEKEKLNSKITINGVEMTVAEAAKKYQELEEKTNSTAEEEAEKAKKAAQDALDIKNAAAEKDGQANLDELKNAAAKKLEKPVVRVETSSNQIARGKKLF